jgi:hypothetical protein
VVPFLGLHSLKRRKLCLSLPHTAFIAPRQWSSKGRCNYNVNQASACFRHTSACHSLSVSQKPNPTTASAAVAFFYRNYFFEKPQLLSELKNLIKRVK